MVRLPRRAGVAGVAGVVAGWAEAAREVADVPQAVGRGQDHPVGLARCSVKNANVSGSIAVKLAQVCVAP